MPFKRWREKIGVWKRAAGLAFVSSVILLAILCLGEFFAATRFESQFQGSVDFREQKHWLLRGDRERGTLVKFSNYGVHSTSPGRSQAEVLELLRKRYPTEFDATKVVWVLDDKEDAFFYRLVPNWTALLIAFALLFALLLVPFQLAVGRRASSYLLEGRLADVLALVQVLAFDRFAHRSEDSLQVELQGQPKSGHSWSSIARGHPELFRVKSAGEHVVSLVARHVADSSDGRRDSLSVAHGAALMDLAIELHDREQQRTHGWQVWVPLIVAFVAGTFTLVGASLSR